MKKSNIIFWSTLIITTLILASCSATKTFTLVGITKIELSSGSTGNAVEITEQEQIQKLILPFNEAEFIKESSSKNVKGYNIRLRFYKDDKMVDEIIVCNWGAIDYKNYFYLTDEGTFDMPYFNELLNE